MSIKFFFSFQIHFIFHNRGSRCGKVVAKNLSSGVYVCVCVCVWGGGYGITSKTIYKRVTKRQKLFAQTLVPSGLELYSNRTSTCNSFIENTSICEPLPFATCDGSNFD